MDKGDLREQIARLEDEIEDSGRTIERCRKVIVASKAAVAIGAILIVAMMLGLMTFDPMAMIGAIAAMVGGTVMFGSNRSTLQQTAIAMQAAEAHRAELIGKIDLRVVDNGAWKGTHGVSRFE